MVQLNDAAKLLKFEYRFGTSTLQLCIQQHLSHCLLVDFDQIRQTNLITVECCACHKAFKLPYERIALDMYCNACKDVQITEEHLQAMQQRLTSIKKRLLGM